MSKKFLSPIKLAQGASNPAVGSAGELFFNTTDVKVYAHNGTTWVPSGGGVTVSATAPATPIAGDAWYDTVDGTLYVYYNDGDSSQWVEVAANSGISVALDGRLGVVETYVTTLQSQMTTAQGDITSLKSRATSLESRATTVESRATNLETASPITVASAAARNTLFPSPVQGQSVFRTDLGSTERFFSAYNSSTNPGGEKNAGWYPSHDGGLVPLIPSSIDSTGTAGRSVSISPTGFVTFSGCVTVSLNNVFSDKYKMYRLVVPKHWVNGNTNLYLRVRNNGTDGGTYYRTGMLWYTNSSGQYWGGYGESVAYIGNAGTANGFSITTDISLDGSMHSMAYGQRGDGTLVSAIVLTYFAGNGDGLTFGMDNTGGSMTGQMQIFGYRS